ncbi:hypothetical protein KUM39_04255 [Streptomyces sp. J2-1]|uniref:hypothetical protein n=1 Tax=Streptomyces corallincola TaxID=2851888 RepID=UPI001C3836A8|nr:hypothetical protein [Streptomyces corallincola]MBV2353577.1 hypothetical protein [Streptomyces corallincola]
MSWDEWEQLKADAVTRGQDAGTRIHLDQLPGDLGGGAGTPAQTGDLRVEQTDLTKIGGAAHTLYNQLWDRGRLSNTGVDAAAGDLTRQGFALGAGLRHVSDKWDTQLKSLLDACAQISNHMQVTKKIHAGDEAYIARRMSGIDTLDAGFDERVGGPGAHNPVHGAHAPKNN